MRWKQTLERYGYRVEQEGVQSDPFSLLGELSRADAVRATVSSTAKRSMDYGQVSVSTTITIQCPQTEAAIHMAGEVSFKQALELTNHGMLAMEPNAGRIPEEI